MCRKNSASQYTGHSLTKNRCVFSMVRRTLGYGNVREAKRSARVKSRLYTLGEEEEEVYVLRDRAYATPSWPSIVYHSYQGSTCPTGGWHLIPFDDGRFCRLSWVAGIACKRCRSLVLLAIMIIVLDNLREIWLENSNYALKQCIAEIRNIAILSVKNLDIFSEVLTIKSVSN